MPTISNITEANQILMGYVPLSKEITGKNMTLARMMPLLEKVGNPHQKLKIVHLAGTSGKTSTAYYIASLLHASGTKVGLTVSPHVDSVTERIQINDQPISDDDLCAYLGEFIDLIGEITPTYFELIIAFAYWVFVKVGVDYAVIETGLGGLHDSTNVANREDKVCVITDIGFDHMNILGNSLTEIAAQKAGIIHKANQVIMYQQSPEIMSAIEVRCHQFDADLHLLDEVSRATEFSHEIDDLPLFQQHNFILALNVFEFVCKRDSLHVVNLSEIIHSSHTLVPGRMDTTKISNKTLIMDGAHNQQKMHALVESFKVKYPGQKADVLLSLKQGKEYPGVLEELLPICQKLILTTFETTQDLPATATDPDIIAEFCRIKGFDSYEIISSQNDAYNALVSGYNNLLLVTGSFYLLSQLRQNKDKHHLIDN